MAKLFDTVDDTTFDSCDDSIIRVVARITDHDWWYNHRCYTNPDWIVVNGERFPPRSLWVSGMVKNMDKLLLVKSVHMDWASWSMPDLYDMSDLVEECCE